MRKLVRRSLIVGVGLMLLSAQAAFAAVTWGSEAALPGSVGYNYSNSLDFTGTPGTGSFKLHDAFVTDAANPAKVQYTSSANGATWSSAKKVSGKQSAEGSSLAAAGSTVIAGWMTGYSYYDANGANRQVQVNVSTDGGTTWSGVQKLSAATGKVDYPIVAAASTTAGDTNVYAAWVNSKSGKVTFRQSTNGGAWSAPISLGTTTATAEGSGYGYAGYANIAATGDLITVVWISANTGTLKVRSINLNGNSAAALTTTNWDATVTLSDKISMTQNGYPIASASALRTNVVTVAYNTDTAQKYTTFTGGGTSAAAAGTLVFTDNATYPGGYSMSVEPAPTSGFVAMWGACKNTGIANPCNYGSQKARFDLVSSSSANGTTWSAPQVVKAAANSAALNDEPSIVVIPDASGVKVFSQYNTYNANYTYYDVWAKTATGSL